MAEDKFEQAVIDKLKSEGGITSVSILVSRLIGYMITGEIFCMPTIVND